MPADSDPVLFDLADDGVATITLNRPDVLNAFGAGMPQLLEKYYRRCDRDDAVRAVILTGAGRAFCAGADMTDAAKTFDLESHGAVGKFSAAAVGFPAFRVRKLMIAAVNGHAIGVGMTLALQCDVRLFALEAKYGIVQVRRGVMPDAYAHWTVSRAVGVARAAEILLTGKTFRGEEIERLGVASQVLPAAEILPAAREMAVDVATHAAPLSVAISKRLLWDAQSLSADEVEREETRLHLHLFARPDAIEGPVAFAQKRAPAWKSTVSQDWPEQED